MRSEYQIVEKLSGQYGSSNTDGAPALAAHIQMHTDVSGN